MKKNPNNPTHSEPDTSSTQPDIDQKIIELEQESAERLAGWQRAQADYQNLKKETDKIRFEAIQFGNQQLIEQFVPIFDNFDLALKHTPTELADNSWVQGIMYIHKQLLDILLESGVEIINPQGQTFNPYLHEAVDAAESDTDAEQIVTEVLQVGYSLHGKLIRSARVKVQ